MLDKKVYIKIDNSISYNVLRLIANPLLRNRSEEDPLIYEIYSKGTFNGEDKYVNDSIYNIVYTPNEKRAENTYKRLASVFENIDFIEVDAETEDSIHLSVSTQIKYTFNDNVEMSVGKIDTTALDTFIKKMNIDKIEIDNKIIPNDFSPITGTPIYNTTIADNFLNKKVIIFDSVKNIFQSDIFDPLKDNQLIFNLVKSNIISLKNTNLLDNRYKLVISFYNPSKPDIIQLLNTYLDQNFNWDIWEETYDPEVKNKKFEAIMSTHGRWWDGLKIFGNNPSSVTGKINSYPICNVQANQHQVSLYDFDKIMQISDLKSDTKLEILKLQQAYKTLKAEGALLTKVSKQYADSVDQAEKTLSTINAEINKLESTKEFHRSTIEITNNEIKKNEAKLKKLLEDISKAKSKLDDFLRDMATIESSIEQHKQSQAAVQSHLETLKNNVPDEIEMLLVINEKTKKIHEKGIELDLKLKQNIFDVIKNESLSDNQMYQTLESKGLFIDYITVVINGSEYTISNKKLHRFKSILNTCGNFGHNIQIKNIAMHTIEPNAIYVDKPEKKENAEVIFGGPYNIFVNNTGTGCTLELTANGSDSIFGWNTITNDALYIHPHANPIKCSNSIDDIFYALGSKTTACLGEAVQAIHNGMVHCDIRLVIWQVWSWITSANSITSNAGTDDGDAWGRNWVFFPSEKMLKNYKSINQKTQKPRAKKPRAVNKKVEINDSIEF